MAFSSSSPAAAGGGGGSLSSSSYRDRTSEFRSLSERLKKIQGLAPPPKATEDDPSTSAVAEDSSSAVSRSEFNKRASRIGLGIHNTSQKIARLAKLAKQSSIFDDPILEIQELSALIKNEIAALNAALSDLQFIQNSEIADGNCSKDRVAHATTICDDLKSRLMGTTKQFKDVLTTRTENLRAHENRKQIFSANTARDDSFQHHPKAVTEPPPWASASSTMPSATLPLDGVKNGSQLRRRLAGESVQFHHLEVSMLQQVAPRQENYTQNRATALQSVESTISELGGIFTQLATMVAQQGELAIRIDDNMDETLANVDSARGALVKHLNQISSNRWLLIKIFVVLVIFLTVFVFFVV